MRVPRVGACPSGTCFWAASGIRKPGGHAQRQAHFHPAVHAGRASIKLTGKAYRRSAPMAYWEGVGVDAPP